jgi:hypothetical protein
MDRIVDHKNHVVEISRDTWDYYASKAEGECQELSDKGVWRGGKSGKRHGEQNVEKCTAEGKVAEVVPRIRLGLPLKYIDVRANNGGGDGGIDGLYLSYYYQNKWTAHAGGHLIFQPDQPSHLKGLKYSDAWFLVVPVDLERRRLRIAGWAFAREMPGLWRWEEERYKKKSPCFEINQVDLRDFDQFMRIAERVGRCQDGITEALERGHGLGYDFVRKCNFNGGNHGSGI